ncbi:MAG: HIT family protein [Thermoplasmata archaeon]
MTVCQFCQITNHTVKAQIIYESQLALAFLDHRPVSKGHSLVISKRHFENLYDVELDYLYEVFRVAKLVSDALNKLYNPYGINLIQNNGLNAGQTVFHFHVHVIPRYDSEYLRYLGEVAMKRVVVEDSLLEVNATEIRSVMKGL